MHILQRINTIETKGFKRTIIPLKKITELLEKLGSTYLPTLNNEQSYAIKLILVDDTTLLTDFNYYDTIFQFEINTLTSTESFTIILTKNNEAYSRYYNRAIGDIQKITIEEIPKIIKEIYTELLK